MADLAAARRTPFRAPYIGAHTYIRRSIFAPSSRASSRDNNVSLLPSFLPSFLPECSDDETRDAVHPLFRSLRLHIFEIYTRIIESRTYSFTPNLQERDSMCALVKATSKFCEIVDDIERSRFFFFFFIFSSYLFFRFLETKRNG